MKNNNGIIIIGFDPGETTGYARMCLVDRKIGIEDFGIVPIKGSLFYQEFWNWLDNYLHQVITEKGLSPFLHLDNRLGKDFFFAIEAPIPMKIAPATQVRADEVRGIIKAIAEKYGIKYFLYQSTSVKKSFGSGRHTKAQLRRVVQMILKTGALKSPDVADALAVATCCALREFKADLEMENLYRTAPKKRMTKKKIADYSDEEIEKAVQEGRAVMKGKRIVKIVES